ncbi:DUF6816 family protein [Gloeothece verrucosa]|uniref:DUF6816 domain-containing protein n=1 Tax=Gloeothece verrucosa (strain PCC 7822) TaxID=497965 RepID=E0UF12_GLOV7|nr:hypothetical protein [Gloeothece verrucosa]ADN14264.1 conserved hypothetical protein [Gloeothece verrucosa PCC 7822]
MKFFLAIILTIFFLISHPIPSQAASLKERLLQYPQWTTKPTLKEAKEDLIYPDWMEGTWKVSSILVDQIAPLAPEIVTPGFENSRQYINQPIEFEVRFQKNHTYHNYKSFLPKIANKKASIVADREFNSLNIAKAYLGGQGVLKVKVDPNNPNRQIIFLPENRQIIYSITKRDSQTPTPHQFISSELTQQMFRSESSIYLNEVETTTAYQLLESGDIKAQQVTAIYLSPKDPQYFQAARSPVSLYHYELQLAKIASP